MSEFFFRNVSETRTLKKKKVKILSIIYIEILKVGYYRRDDILISIHFFFCFLLYPIPEFAMYFNEK